MITLDVCAGGYTCGCGRRARRVLPGWTFRRRASFPSGAQLLAPGDVVLNGCPELGASGYRDTLTLEGAPYHEQDG
jgi:hypothetical protein